VAQEKMEADVRRAWKDDPILDSTISALSKVDGRKARAGQ
jgi:hypothetical protein